MSSRYLDIAYNITGTVKCIPVLSMFQTIKLLKEVTRIVLFL